MVKQVICTRRTIEPDLRQAVTASAAELVGKITDNVQRFTGTAPKADDVTVLALRWRPAP
jgi:serine phosphatase RsbU (regulator of sigma subunit)